MEARKLTPEQIDDLYTFCAERGVYHYDLQLELVDHFATGIEKQWSVNYDLTLEQALETEYNIFNINQFKQIITEKEECLTDKYMSLQKKYVAELFQWPLISRIGIFAIFVFLVFIAIKSYFVVFYLYSFGYCFILGIFKYILFPYNYRYRPSLEKSFLLIDNQDNIKESINLTSHFSTLIFGSIFLFIYPDLSNWMVYLSKFVLALSFTTSTMFVVAAYKYVPQHIKADFIREFPQFIKS